MSAPAASTIAVSVTSATRGMSTPIVYTENGAQHFGRDDKRAIPRYTRLARESKHYFLGPMPVEQFLDTFLVKPHSELENMPPPECAFASLPKLNTEPVGSGEQTEAFHSQHPTERQEGAPKRKKRKQRADEEEDPDVKAAQKALKQERKFSESSIYPHLVHALNPHGLDPPRCPGYIFCNTSKKADDAGGRVGAVKPDICCYATGRILDLPYVDTNDAYTNTGLIATFIEVKARTDFFSDPPSGATAEDRAHHPFVLDHIRDAQQHIKAAEALGQNIAYALEVLGRQFRHCCYSVSVTCPSARLIRWDRAGAIVTEAFDLHERPDLLCKFFWCFSKLSRADQGYDLTVELASPLEERLFREAMLIHIASQTGKIPDEITGPPEELRQHYTPGRVSRVRFTLDSHRQSHSLLISRPIASPLSAFGRCTRGFWAVYCTWEYDHQARKVILSDWEVVFLKDTWRYDTCTDDVQEGAVLREMQGSVRNIPEVIVHEDVLRVNSAIDVNGEDVPIETAHNRCTETQDYLTEENMKSWICGYARSDLKILRHTQYRMVLNVVGYTLRCLRGTKELFHASYHAFQAAMDAADAGRIHRDITPANIILVKEHGAGFDTPRRGYLCDWDLSRPKDYINDEDYEVSATWQFQSIEVLRRRAKAEPFTHLLECDMESILYTVLYCALFFLEVTGGDPEACIENMFDAVLNRKGDSWGGDGKSANALDRSYTSDLTWACPDTKIWIDRVMELHHPVTTPLIQRMQPANQWTASNLNAFWRDFLARRPGLPLVDRHHGHFFTAVEKPPEAFLSRFMRGVPNPAPVGYTARGVVNKRPISPSEELAPPKNRRRIHGTQPVPCPEPGVVSPSTEPPPSSILADSDDSESEEGQDHGTVSSGEAAIHQLFPYSTSLFPTSIPPLAPPLSSKSIDAYITKMYGDTLSPFATETGTASTSGSTAGQASATQETPWLPLLDRNRYVGQSTVNVLSNRRERGQVAHDARWAQLPPPSEDADHTPQAVYATRATRQPLDTGLMTARTGTTLAAAGTSRPTASDIRGGIPGLVGRPDAEEAAHISRSDNYCDTSRTPIATEQGSVSVSTNPRTSGRRRTRRTPGGY